MAYATVQDVQARMLRTMTSDEQSVCAVLLDDAAVMIDAAVLNAAPEAAKVVSCRMGIRAIGDGPDSTVPMGATQGSMSALGYQQSWTFGASGAAAGELYIAKADRRLLGLGDQIGSYSPVQELAPPDPTAEVPAL